MRRLRFGITALAVSLAAGFSGCDDDEDDAPSDEGSRSGVSCEAPGDGAEAIDEAMLYVEYNATDGDLGVHGSFGADGWSELCVYAPDGTQVLGVEPASQLGALTMASLFFESREPELADFGFAELEAGFPEGAYEVRALSYDGTSLVGTATFSHAVPEQPTILFPPLAEDEEGAGEVVLPTHGLMIRWEEVAQTVGGDPVSISGYEVIITKVEHDDPNGFSRPVYDVHVPPDRRRLAVPADFLESDTLYELEVLALEASGNQTITVGFFTSAPAPGPAEEIEDTLAAIEHNTSAGDLGFHLAIDAPAWSRMSLVGPGGDALLEVSTRGSVGSQGLTSLSFESRELPFDELSFDDFLARFAQGEYTLTGETVEGQALTGTIELSHIIPDAPVILSPTDGEEVAVDSVVIAWEPVTTPDDVEIDVYQLMFYPADPPEGEESIDLDIDLELEVPAEVTQVRIPPELLEAGAAYEFEVVAVEAEGNKTLTVGRFATR